MTLQQPPRRPPTAEFERSAWQAWDTVHTPARQVDITITKEHVDRALWGRFHDPVSLAVEPVLQKNACVQVFWNSDSYRPLHAQDDARLGVSVEIQDDTGHTTREESYWVPLPRRATRAMLALARRGPDNFTPVTMRVKLPTIALA